MASDGHMTDQQLGKRSAHAMDVEPVFDWMPGAGIPFYPHGEAAEVERRVKAMKTSLLYSELEAEVEAEAQAARAARHNYECREWQISAEVASRFPMCVGGDDFHEATTDAAAAHAQASMSTLSTPVAAVECNAVSIVKAAARRAIGPVLPAPLHERSINKALPQLPEGARSTVLCVLDTWKNGRLGDEDLVETIRSFAGSSMALRELFSADPQCVGEVASPADMRHLKQMAQ